MDYQQYAWAKEKIDIKKNNIYSYRLRWMVSEINNLKLTPQKILEVGCGGGGQVAGLLDSFPNSILYGCDISRYAIDVARKYHKQINFEVTSAEKMEYPDEYFDFIFLFDVLEHLENPKLAIKEVNRTLKKDQYFHIFVPIERQKRTLFSVNKKCISPSIQDLKRKYYGHIQSFDVNGIINLLEKENFKILKKSFSFHFFGQIQDMIDLYFQHFISEKKINNFFLNTIYKILFRLNYSLMLIEDYFLRNNSRAIGLHLTCKKAQ